MSEKWEQVIVAECPKRGQVFSRTFSTVNGVQWKFCEDCGEDHKFTLMVGRWISRAKRWPPSKWFAGEWEIKGKYR